MGTSGKTGLRSRPFLKLDGEMDFAKHEKLAVDNGFILYNEAGEDRREQARSSAPPFRPLVVAR